VNGQEFVSLMTLFLLIAGLLWKGIDSYHKQRMALIENGGTIGQLPTIFRKANPLASLKWGLLAIFVGAGLLLGIILNTNFHVVEEATPALGLIMGGLALVTYYRIASSKVEK
jgi:hypothetical protein